MKKLHLFLLACAAVALNPQNAVLAAPPPAGVALRYVTAAHAFTAIKDHLGGNAADAVTSVDEKKNLIALDITHTQSPIVRAFLAGLDQAPGEVLVDATITRRVDASGPSPARHETLSRRIISPQTRRAEALQIPGDEYPTRVEIRVTQIGK